MKQCGPKAAGGFFPVAVKLNGKHGALYSNIDCAFRKGRITAPAESNPKRKVFMLYIGNFYYFSNQQAQDEETRRHGEFNLIVEADAVNNAVESFMNQILSVRKSGEMLEGDCNIYFSNLIEMDRFPKTNAAMLNFKSVVGDPLIPYIGCTVPTEGADDCKIVSWEDNRPEIEGKGETLFLRFKSGEQTPETVASMEDRFGADA